MTIEQTSATATATGPVPLPPRRYPADALTAMAAAALGAVGCPDEEAALVATSLVAADARGLASHGLLRLPLYIEAVEAGGIVPGAAMTWQTQRRAATAHLDAAYGFGQSAMVRATDRAAGIVADLGCAVVVVRRSTHFGIGAPWAERLAEGGLIALLMSNTGPSVAAHGSREPLLGTNPLTLAVPAAGRRPMVLDMATSAAAYGRIVSARAEGKDIPDSWAVDAAGAATTDPAAALNGALRAFGGHKGSGLAVLIEALAGALPGAAFSYEITDIWADRSSRMGTGHVLIVLDPAAFALDFSDRVASMAECLAGSNPAAGVDRVMLPGDIEHARAAEAARHGVPVGEGTTTQLEALAKRLGTPAPPPPNET